MTDNYENIRFMKNKFDKIYYLKKNYLCKSMQQRFNMIKYEKFSILKFTFINISKNYYHLIINQNYEKIYNWNLKNKISL